MTCSMVAAPGTPYIRLYITKRTYLDNRPGGGGGGGGGGGVTET